MTSSERLRIACSPPPAVTALPPLESAPRACDRHTGHGVEQVVEEIGGRHPGPAPLPRRKPTMTAAVKRTDPPCRARGPTASGAAERVDRGADRRRRYSAGQ